MSSISSIDEKNRNYINLMRGISITRVVLVHLGLSWFYPPYSQFINVFLPVLFFVSGGVTFFSFKRSKDTQTFLINRMLTIYVPYLIIVLGAFLVLWAYNFSIPSLDLYYVFQWLTFNPHAVIDSMPFPIHQVWYLHSLAIIILIAPLFFKLAIKNSLWLLLPVLISIVMGIAQHFSEYGRNLFLAGHNLYQPMVNMGFFMLGAFVYENKHWFTFRSNGLLLITCIALGILAGFIQTQDILMSKHTYAPDFYYIILSFAAIFLFLTFQEPISFICHKIKGLEWFFYFMSKHSYSVFLLHSLVLDKIHHWFDLGNIAEDPKKAVIKIVSVVIVTCIIAVPITRLSDAIVKRLRPIFLNRQLTPKLTS